MPSARILLLDDDEDVLTLVADTLKRDGFNVSSASLPSAALKLAHRFEFELVVADVNLPEMNGFEFRDAYRAKAAAPTVPFVFLSAADEAVEQEIANRVKGDPLLLKPFSRSDLRRVVHGALKFWRVVLGTIPGQLDNVLREIEETSGTGILTASRPEVTKKVVFQDGKVVFAFSSDARDLIGQAFIRAGLISERDLLAAFERKATMRTAPGTPQLAAALAALSKVTPEQSRAVFERKVRESVLDLFLWKGGEVEFAETELREADRPFPTKLETAEIRREGLQRRAHWKKVEALLPDREVAFARTGKDLPAGFPRSSGERQLVQHIDEGRTFAELLLETHGQDYAVGMRLASLVQSGVLTTAASQGFRGPARAEEGGLDLQTDREFQATFEKLFEELDEEPAKPAEPLVTTRPVPAAQPTPSGGVRMARIALVKQAVPRASVSGAGAIPAAPPALESSAPPKLEETPEWAKLFAGALVLLRHGNAEDARRDLLRVLEMDPRNALARSSLEKAERQLAEQARQAGLTDDRILTLAVPLTALVGKHLAANHAFVLSRLAAGRLSVSQLLQLCPLPSWEVLHLLHRCLRDRLIR